MDAGILSGHPICRYILRDRKNWEMLSHQRNTSEILNSQIELNQSLYVSGKASGKPLESYSYLIDVTVDQLR